MKLEVNLTDEEVKELLSQMHRDAQELGASIIERESDGLDCQEETITLQAIYKIIQKLK